MYLLLYILVFLRAEPQRWLLYRYQPLVYEYVVFDKGGPTHICLTASEIHQHKQITAAGLASPAEWVHTLSACSSSVTICSRHYCIPWASCPGHHEYHHSFPHCGSHRSGFHLVAHISLLQYQLTTPVSVPSHLYRAPVSFCRSPVSKQ